MYKFSYAEVLDGSLKEARERERVAVARSIELLKAAEAKGADSREAVEALTYTRRLWAAFMEDLAKQENDLPKALRADLISIGLWIMREAEDIRLGKSQDFKALIEVSSVISEGLA
jgi:flagellar protein FlaF